MRVQYDEWILKTDSRIQRPHTQTDGGTQGQKTMHRNTLLLVSRQLKHLLPSFVLLMHRRCIHSS